MERTIDKPSPAPPIMLVKLISLFGIADASGPEIDQGANLRWLAESAWFPYAFLGDQIKWEAIDNHSARARYLARACLLVHCSISMTTASSSRFTRTDIAMLAEGEPYSPNGLAAIQTIAYSTGSACPRTLKWHGISSTKSFTYARFQVTVLEYNASERF